MSISIFKALTKRMLSTSVDNPVNKEYLCFQTNTKDKTKPIKLITEIVILIQSQENETVLPKTLIYHHSQYLFQNKADIQGATWTCCNTIAFKQVLLHESPERMNYNKKSEFITTRARICKTVILSLIL